MQTSSIPNVYMAIGAGIVIWLLGQKWGSKRLPGERASKFGKFLSFVGFALFTVSAYAGFRGPLTIAGVTLDRFPFYTMTEQVSAEALAYARNNLAINREPAIGWHGASKTALKYTVKNNGDKKIARMAVRFSTTSGSSLDLPVHGPFPAKKTTTAIVEVPANVSRSYFKSSRANPGEIVSARF